MGAESNHDLPAQLAEAFAWWREAGVDCDFHDEPTQWLSPPAALRDGEPVRKAPPPRPQAASPLVVQSALAADPSVLPKTLDEFATWWLAEPLLDGGRTSDRVPPRGARGAQLMVIVPQPEAEDSDRLLSGPQGRLLEAMLNAMGVQPEQAYVASALPRHTPMADWDALAAHGMGNVLAHHVHLAAPARLVAFGSSILPLFGNDSTNKPAAVRRFNHEDVSVPMLAARDLAALLERPRWKAEFWRAWLEWTSEAEGLR